ncbi:MAG: CDP-alcohol phosphatidyltransferase family protein [Burkholderiaceae bacterium]|jgi:phosphatidylglycerophosphate synthase
MTRLPTNRAAWIPLTLTGLRAALAPVMVLLALAWPLPWAFGACLVAAFLSDVFDGVVARQLGVATPGLRRLDSIADSIFYVGALFAAWHLHPSALRDHAAALVVLGVLEVARYAFDLRKFGKEASYHMWSSKLWGVALFVGFVALLAFGEEHWFVAAAIWIGIAADIEGLAISFTLDAWRNDVPTIWHARRLRG